MPEIVRRGVACVAGGFDGFVFPLSTVCATEAEQLALSRSWGHRCQPASCLEAVERGGDDVGVRAVVTHVAAGNLPPLHVSPVIDSALPSIHWLCFLLFLLLCFFFPVLPALNTCASLPSVFNASTAEQQGGATISFHGAPGEHRRGWRAQASRQEARGGRGGPPSSECSQINDNSTRPF